MLLAVWAGDTFAFLVGRLVGRHKLAPRISPGKTWEGFVAGTAATVFVAFVALYDQRDEFLSIGQAILLGLAIAATAPLGDLFESMLKRDMGVKDSGRAARRPRRDARPDRRAALRVVAAFYVILAFDDLAVAGQVRTSDSEVHPSSSPWRS